MKRVLLVIIMASIVMQALAIEKTAREMVVSSWAELTDIVLRPQDIIIKVDKQQVKDFSFKKSSCQHGATKAQAKAQSCSPCPENSQEQYPQARIVRVSSEPVVVDRAKGSDYWEQEKEWNKARAKDGLTFKPRPDYTLPRSSSCRENSFDKNYFICPETPAGKRYCIEEDSWWKTSLREREKRRIVLVPEDQKGACWRSVLVIQPKIFNDGYKWIGANFTYEDLEEYRFSNQLKIAGLVGLGAGLLAFIKTIA